MLGRYGGRNGLRRMAAAAAVTMSLVAPAAISAQEADQPATATAPVAAPVENPPAAPTQPSDPAPAPVPPQATAPAATETAPVPAAAAPAEAPAMPVTVSRASASATKAVSIVNFAYSPAALTVNTGDTVTWTNKDKAPEGHDVTGDGLDSGLMNQGDTYSFTFNSEGDYSYICSIHPSMTGSVEVLARSGESDDDESAGGASGTGASGSVTESEAIASPDAAGTSVTLPASGEPAADLVLASLILLALGLALRALPAVRARG